MLPDAISTLSRPLEVVKGGEAEDDEDEGGEQELEVSAKHFEFIMK